MVARHDNYTHQSQLQPLARPSVISQGAGTGGSKCFYMVVGSASVDINLNMRVDSAYNATISRCRSTDYNNWLVVYSLVLALE